MTIYKNIQQETFIYHGHQYDFVRLWNILRQENSALTIREVITHLSDLRAKIDRVGNYSENTPIKIGTNDRITERYDIKNHRLVDQDQADVIDETNKLKYQFRGKLYTLTELADVHYDVVGEHISPAALQTRLKRLRWPVEKAVVTPLQEKHRKADQFRYTYHHRLMSITEAAEQMLDDYSQYGITERSLRNQIKRLRNQTDDSIRVIDLDKAVADRKIKVNPADLSHGFNKKYRWNNREWTLGELTHIADETFNNSVSGRVLASRLRSGWTIERALKTPVNSHKSTTEGWIYQGRKYQLSQLVQIAKEQYGVQISVYTLASRLSQHHWPVKKAISTPVRRYN